MFRDYTKIKVRNCQLITQYGGKKFQWPFDVTTTTNDDIIMIDNANKDVVVLNRDLNLVRAFGHQGSGDSKLNDPVGIAIHHNVIAISECSNHVVKKFTLQGDYLSKFGTHGSGDSQFTNPQGLTFNSKGLLYVVDHGNCRVQVFDTSDRFLFKFGSKGSDPGQFQHPHYISLDRSDQVYVTDYDRGGVLVFSEDGYFIKKINCNNPYVICHTPDDYIITNDSDSLIVFNPTHQFIAKFGIKGNQRGQFSSIYGIAVNSVGTIFVTEYYNHRLQVIAT